MMGIENEIALSFDNLAYYRRVLLSATTDKEKKDIQKKISYWEKQHAENIEYVEWAIKYYGDFPDLTDYGVKKESYTKFPDVPSVPERKE